ncbi:uncharacterized protein LOC134350231 isoform X1 [Mobula hypostoma]|uniref:uncharacterized protein LOC134350231 isoform X1 n=1 Tax=Mobula hypostoma TaxID=723540 RepID=UPI002FC3BEEA
MSWPLNAEQILRLHNLRQFQDNCTRGKDNELHCQIASQARVEAAGVTLKLQGVPGIVFCEIYNNTSSVECPRQRTQVDWLSIPPQKTSQTPVSTETDGRRVWDTTTNTHVRIVIPGDNVGECVGECQSRWRCTGCQCTGKSHYQQCRYLKQHIHQASPQPPMLQRNLLQPIHSLHVTKAPATRSRQHHGVSPRLSLQCDPSLPVVQSAELYTVIQVQSDQYLVKF